MKGPTLSTPDANQTEEGEEPGHVLEHLSPSAAHSPLSLPLPPKPSARLSSPDEMEGSGEAQIII